MNLPSREELKKEYGIADDDFEILTALPTEEERSVSGGFLMKLSEALGAQRWMWKSFAGTVLAIIILVPQAESITKCWVPKITYSCERLAEYLRTYSSEDDTHPEGYIAFTPQNKQLGLPENSDNILDLPDGSGIFPASGDWLV